MAALVAYSTIGSRQAKLGNNDVQKHAQVVPNALPELRVIALMVVEGSGDASDGG